MHKRVTALLDPKWKLREHIIVLSLAILVIILTGVYIGVSPFVRRADIMAIPFVSCTPLDCIQSLQIPNHPQSVKTLAIVSYQLLSEHTQRFAKWRSLKANLVLNCIEPVFWLTLVILKFMGTAAFCSEGSCAVSWLIALVAMVIL